MKKSYHLDLLLIPWMLFISRLHIVQFCITLDGKTVAEGSKGETDGDIDLWGVDKHHSNVKEALNK